MLKATPRFIALATLCGGLAAGVGFFSCGGDGGGSRTGTGGTTGATGGSGMGGTSGGTGGTSGGTGGAAGLSCATPVAAGATLTDFTEYNAVSGKWGTAPGVVGAVFGYHGAMSTHTATVTAGAFSLSGTVMPGTGDGYMGGGLSFDVCATAAAFTGIEFTVGGSVGGCALELQLQTYSTKSASNGGGCASGCSSATKRNIAASGTVRVSFSELTGAAPNAFSAAELVGIQWQLTIPAAADGGIQTPCTVALTFDDVKFVN